jgi:hypothetical protein
MASRIHPTSNPYVKPDGTASRSGSRKMGSRGQDRTPVDLPLFSLDLGRGLRSCGGHDTHRTRWSLLRMGPDRADAFRWREIRPLLFRFQESGALVIRPPITTAAWRRSRYQPAAAGSCCAPAGTPRRIPCRPTGSRRSGPAHAPSCLIGTRARLPGRPGGNKDSESLKIARPP